MGFSVANLDILAMSSFRFSGGKMLSSHSVPLLSIPPTVPCRAPVAPLSASAMLLRTGMGDVLKSRIPGRILGNPVDNHSRC